MLGSTLKWRVGGGKFNTSNPKSELQWAVEEAATKPGPGFYEVRPKESTG